jgi:hypothetical protein
MSSNKWTWLPAALFTVVVVIAAAAGCDDDGPPLDELPLRDALRADPEVLAALSPASRRRLAARLAAARASDRGADQLDDDDADAAESPRMLVAALDRTRVGRHGDPLIVGAIAARRAWPLPQAGALGGDDGPALPPIAGEPAAATAPLEKRALEGRGEAQAALRALVRVAGAERLERVVGWPVGAIAVGGVVYVNAAWLVALAPSDDDSDGGADGGAPTPGGTGAREAPAGAREQEQQQEQERALALAQALAQAQPQQHAAQAAPSSTGTGDWYPDGGPPPEDPPPLDPGGDDSCAAFADACVACADASSNDDGCSSSSSSDESCESTDDGSGESCESADGSDESCESADDGSDESCESSSSDSDEACSSTGDSGGDDAAACQVGRRGSLQRPRPRPRSRAATIVWLAAPVAVLLFRRRR